MNDEQTNRALALWSAGRNTADIARMLGVPESLVANNLPQIIDRRRERLPERRERTSVDRYARKLRECGFPKHVIKLEVAKMEAMQ
ncbi:MAG: hypothetical protein JWM36_1853 [Hyphomicrobiales bacterium]|nr:hypothetical protein [Hyphomicrobiales bacterium]